MEANKFMDEDSKQLDRKYCYYNTFLLDLLASRLLEINLYMVWLYFMAL